MGKRIGLARMEALLENLKREIDFTGSDLLIGKKQAATHGAGAISTEIAPVTYISKVSNEIITTIQVDLTGLKTKSDVGDAIGIDGTDACHLLQYNSTTHGVLYKVSMSCIELPTAASNVLLDIDLITQSAADAAYDDDVSGGTAILTAGGNFALGTTLQNLVVGAPTTGHYLVMADGATHSAASVFTAGKFLIKLHGYASF